MAIRGDHRTIVSVRCYHDETARIESSGKSLDICADPRQLEDQMLALSPADAHQTKEFIRLLSPEN
jgi:hypothetical protein